MIQKLIEHIIRFRDKRQWKKFHTPLNLAISLQLEVAELLEEFQWKDNRKFLEEYRNSSKKKRVAEEMADVFTYLLLLANTLDIDLERAFFDKMKQNDKKYPVEKAKGNAIKYNRL